MASLNLIPNPTVLAVQAGVFLVNYVVIKKLLVEPYLTVRDRREALTVGSKGDATRALAECEAIAAKVEEKISAAAGEAKKVREASRDQALARRNELLAAASKDAKAAVAAVEADVKGQLAAERAKIPSVVASLTNEVYKLALA